MTGDVYVAEVLRRLPRQLIDRERVELDLRTHLVDRMEAGATEEEAVAHMGSPEDTAEELMEGVELKLASVRRRIAAFVLDVMLGAIPLVMLCLLFLAAQLGRMSLGEGGHWETAVAGGGFMLIVAIMVFTGLAITVLSVLYFPAMEAVFGQTLGKRALGLVVVRENGTTIGWMHAIVRRLPFFLEFFLIDAIFVFFTKRRQRAFDKVAGTIVVRVPGERAPDTRYGRV